MLTIYQNKNLLSGVSLGTLNDADLPDGIHLRWMYNPAIAYPGDGFRISRRPHDKKQFLKPAFEIKVPVDTLHASTSASLITTMHHEYMVFKKTQGLTISTVRYSGTEYKGFLANKDVLHVQLDKRLVPYFMQVVAVFKDRNSRLYVKGYMNEELKIEEKFTINGQATGSAPAFDIYLENDGINRLEITGEGAVLLGMKGYLNSAMWTLIGKANLPVSSNYPDTETKVIERIGNRPQANLPVPYRATDSQLKKFYTKQAKDLKASWESLKVMPDEGFGTSPTDIVTPVEEGNLDFEFPEAAALLLLSNDYNLSRIMGLAFHDATAAQSAGLPFDYQVTGYWKIEGQPLAIQWVIYAVTASEAAKLNAPASLSGKINRIPSLSRPENSPVLLSYHACLNWSREGYKDPVPTQFLIERKTDTGDWKMLSMQTYANTFNTAKPLLINIEEDEDGRKKDLYTQELSSFGTYQYRVRALDLFGRVSKPGNTIRLKHEDNLQPPSPDAVKTVYLDEQDEELSERDKSSLLYFQKVTRNRNAGNIVRIEWEWPEDNNLIYPGMKDFAVYFKDGLLNTISGMLIHWKDVSDTSCTVDTSFDLSTYTNAVFTGDKAEVFIQGRSFPIISHDYSTGSKMELGCKPLKSPRGSLTMPFQLPVTAGIQLNAGNQSFKDYTKTLSWGNAFSHLLIANSEPVDTGSNIRIVTEWGFPKTITYEASGNVPVSSPTKKVKRYSILISGLAFGAFNNNVSKSYYHVGVTARRINAAGSILESAVAGPAPGYRINRVPPVFPQFPLVTKLYTSLADRNQAAWFTLQWASEAANTYTVWRTGNVQLNTVSEKENLVFRDDLEPELRLRAIAVHAAGKQSFSVSGESALKATGSLTEFKDRFNGLASESYVYHVEATSPSATPSKWPVLIDAEWHTLVTPGINDQTYATTKEKLLQSFLVVEVPDVTPPAIPRLQGLFPGDNECTLVWRRDPELENKNEGYRIFRTDNSSLALDLLNMQPLGSEPLYANSPQEGLFLIEEEGHEEVWSYADKTIIPGREYFYQLIAIRKIADGIELQSKPLPAAISARPYSFTPPAVLKWYNISWNSSNTEISLTWFKPVEPCAIQVLAQRTGSNVWQQVLEWKDSTADVFTEREINTNEGLVVVQDSVFTTSQIPVENTSYLLQARDAFGNISRSEVYTLET